MAMQILHKSTSASFCKIPSLCEILNKFLPVSQMQMHKYKLRWDVKDFSAFFPNPVTLSTRPGALVEDLDPENLKAKKLSRRYDIYGLFSGQPQRHLHPNALVSPKFSFSNEDRENFMDVVLNLSVVETPGTPWDYNLKLGVAVCWQETPSHMCRDNQLKLDILRDEEEVKGGFSWHNAKSRHTCTCSSTDGIHKHKNSFTFPESLGALWKEMEDNHAGSRPAADIVRIEVTVTLLGIEPVETDKCAPAEPDII